MINQSFVNTQTLYEQDFYLWTQAIVEQLKKIDLVK